MTAFLVKNLRETLARVRSALMRRGRNAQDADDLVQEAWVRLACYESEQPVERPEAFLMRTALNLSIDAHRMRVCHGEEVLLEDVVLLDVAPGTEAIVLARERMERLSQCLGRLNDKTREIFLSYRVDGMTYREIAQHHGLSISTVEKHIAKATLQLTTWMEGW
jgi:RNA polymerase sigma factor (sigma-70 family)